MPKQRVYISYQKWSDNALSTLGGRTATFLTGNAFFPDLPVPIIDYAVLAEDYRTMLELAIRSGSKLEITAKNNARRKLLEAMRQQAFYVNTIANGDAHVLASSGFIQIDAAQSLKPPFAPLLVRLRDGNRQGELLLTFESITNAWEYEYSIASERNGMGELIWGPLHSTTNTRANTIEGLEEGVRYHVRVRARNGRGISDWSQPVSIIAR